MDFDDLLVNFCPLSTLPDLPPCIRATGGEGREWEPTLGNSTLSLRKDEM